MVRTSCRRGVPAFVCAIATTLTVTSFAAAPSQAVGVDDFATPLLSSNSSQQWSRLPDPEALLCSERCETGILRKPAIENGVSEYIPSGPASWGVLSANPALVGKVARFYRGGDVYAAASIIEVLPGISEDGIVKDLVKDDSTNSGGAPGLTITSETPQSDGWTLWMTNAATRKDYPAEKFRAAYATKGNEIIRVSCSGPMKPGERLCGGIGEEALKIARAVPSASIPPAVARLAPSMPIPGLTPVFAAESTSSDFWGELAQAPKPMMKALAPSTLTLQWTVNGSPRLALYAAITSTKSQAALEEFLSTLCEKGDEYCTPRSDLGPVPAGGQAAGSAIFAAPQVGADVSALEYQAGDGRRQIDVVCTANSGRTLKQREVAACKRAIKNASRAWFPK